MEYLHHIAFTPPAAGSLNHSFRLNFTDANVYFLTDDYTLGPIKNPEQEKRRSFLSNYLMHCPYQDDIHAYINESNLFWQTIISLNGPVAIWYSKKCAVEYAGFLELLSRIEPDNLWIIDVSSPQVEVQNKKMLQPKSCGECSPEMLHDLMKYLSPITEREYAQCNAMWDALANDRGDFRIIRDGVLQTVPVSWYDTDLLSLIPDSWTKAARIIGEGLGRFSDEYVNIGDTFLFLRLYELEKQGSIEMRNGPHWNRLEIKKIR